MRKKLTRRDITLAAILAFLIGLLVGLLVCRIFHDDGAGPGSGPGDAGGTGGVGGVHGASTLEISGDAEGLLVPGSTLPIDLAVDNPNDFDFAINHLTVSVTAVHAPQSSTNRRCSTADFEVSPLAEGVELTLGAGTEESLTGLAVAPEDWPTVGMINRPVNQDGCKGATLTLHYKASGLEVHR